MSLLNQAAAALALHLATALPAAVARDARLREVAYDPDRILSVPVRRGVVTLVVLGEDESLVEAATGLGADCAKADAAWCIAVQPGARTLFVKPRSTATAANNVTLVTNRRVHHLRFEVLGEGAPHGEVYRLTIHAPPAPVPAPVNVADATPAPRRPPARSAAQIVNDRMAAPPVVLNTAYSLAQGRHAQDIVPSMVFDDGRFTYLRLGGNREIPAVFHVLDDGSETLVNARMQDDLLVVDRVSRRLMLRAGPAVVGIWNDAFDGQGHGAEGGTTVDGVRRVLRASALPSHPTGRPVRENP